MRIGARVRVSMGFHLEGTEWLPPMTVATGTGGRVYGIEPDQPHPIAVLLDDGRIIQFSSGELEVVG